MAVKLKYGNLTFRKATYAEQAYLGTEKSTGSKYTVDWTGREWRLRAWTRDGVFFAFQTAATAGELMAKADLHAGKVAEL